MAITIPISRDLEEGEVTPLIPAEATAPAISKIETVADIEGIPQSSSAPNNTEAFGENPWDVEEQEYQTARGEWFAKSREKMDRYLDDPDTEFADFDMGIARTNKEAVTLYQNDAFVQLHYPEDNLPDPNGLARKLRRVQLADQLFKGRGAESEEEFNAEIHRERIERKNVAALRVNLAESAFASAILSAGGEKGKSFAEWREEAKAMPGYKPEMDGDLYAAYHEYRKSARETVEPFEKELTEVRRAMKNGGQSNVSQRIEAGIKTSFLGGQDEALPSKYD